MGGIFPIDYRHLLRFSGNHGILTHKHQDGEIIIYLEISIVITYSL